MNNQQKEKIISLLEKEFPDWVDGYRECLEDAVELVGEEPILKFLGSGDWQKQDMVTNVLQAIRGHN